MQQGGFVMVTTRHPAAVVAVAGPGDPADPWAGAWTQARLTVAEERRLSQQMVAGRRAAARLAAADAGSAATGRLTPRRRQALAALVTRGMAARTRLVYSHLALVALIADRFAW